MSVIRRALLNKNIVSFKTGFYGFRTLSTRNPENKNILCSGYEDVLIPQITIPEMVYSGIAQFHKYTATECPLTGRKYTFEQLRVKSRNLSKALRKKLKLSKGDVVAILLPNVPEFPIASLAILEAGLIVTTLNPLYSSEEISRQLADSSAKAIITLVELYDAVKASALLYKKPLPMVTIKTTPDQSTPQGTISFDEWTSVNLDISDFEPGSTNDVAFLPYSSGTTGLPKGVELTHNNIVANVTQLNHPDFSYIIPTTDNHQDTSPVILPMFHIYGFTVTVYMLVNGVRSLTLPKFTPESYVSTLKNYDNHLIFAAPPLVLFLSSYPEVKPEYLKNVRIVNSGAAPLGALDENRFLEKCQEGVKILQGYGLTETSPVISVTSVKLREKVNCAGSIGSPVPNTLVKIVPADDHTGEALGPNQTGELVVKGPQVMRGYHNRPKETENAFVDGWLRTGDLAYYNDDGILFITDRLKELIKVKGFQVAPAELEEILRNFPSVDDAAVIGIPHPIYGEVPRAYVVPKKNKEIESRELEQFVAGKVANFKQLKGGIAVVESIPKNPAGKILRRQLKLKYASERSEQ